MKTATSLCIFTLLTTLGTLVVTTASAQETAHRPNIVMIVVDDMRWDDLGCMGHPFVKTPNIDRVANEGVKFTNAFCTTPLCSPVRGSILTGQYPHTNGIIDNTNRSEQSHQLTTFPLLLKDSAGYRTGFVGKWHMGNDSSQRPGFDYWACLKGQGQAYNPELTNTDGETEQTKGHISDILSDRGIEFIEQSHAADPKQPFMLYLAHKALVPDLHQADDGSVKRIGGSKDQTPDGRHGNVPTGKRIPAKRHENLYTGEKVPRRPNIHDDLSGKPALTRVTPGMPPLSPETGTPDSVIIDRLRMIAAIDEGVGRIFDALEKTGDLDNTLFIFSSDHGYFYGEHYLEYQSRLAYEETLRIPLLVRYPPMIKAGTETDFTTISIDFAPTFLDLAGAPAREEIQGRSLVPVLQGETVEPRTSFLVEYYSDTVWPRIRDMGYKAVRTDRWKYIRYNKLRGMDELYDLKADPYEITNIIKDPAAADTLKAAQSELDRLLKETGD